MTFDPALFAKHMDEALTVAEGIRAPVEIRAKVRKQGGVEILVGRCVCGEVAGLAGEGKHLCRRCSTWLEYKREG